MTSNEIARRPSRAVERLIERIASAHARIREQPRDTLRLALDVGDQLADLKQQVPEGSWLDSLKQTSLSERTARTYMQLAANRQQVEAADAQSIRQALGLLRPKAQRAPRASGPTADQFAAGYRRGWRERGEAETRVAARPEDGALAGVSERDLRFAIKQLHPDRFATEDQEVIARARRWTELLLAERSRRRS